ncbi:hypothetical protein Pla108_35390 [Botrimarina colliarenosi]|uniref:DUF4062 domain-containing protein n=1 Tax=Botrimarina colliarenosi TaxID=2528001 RepID=A0A5C6A8P8_9BACT|nr:DUF4062 domain-containing protein [Botrimarina colliarenosi]TWT95391.1 hypothetical protein Pla108_35390 [Botrimarina colliarenosi]
MKVFVSSVMRGFEPERAAVRRAIELLRHDPVMAEGFGAQPHSSEIACVEQVRGSDVYLGVLGSRYGYKTPEGVSVTEAEYLEARQRGLRIVFFATRDQLDADQADFFARVGDYQQGYFVGFYSTPQDLQDAVVQALNDLQSTTGPAVSAADAGARLQQRFAVAPPRRGAPTFSVGIVPKRVDEWVPVGLLGDEAFRDDLKKLLLFGERPRLFDDRYGCLSQEGVDHVVLSQSGDGATDRSASVSLYQDGTILSVVTLAQPRGGFAAGDLAKSTIIDRRAVQEGVHGALRFADAVFQRLPRGGLLSDFYVWLCLSEFKHKLFGEPDQHRGNSISFPSLAVDDPLWIPIEPLSTSRPALVAGDLLATDLVERLARVFLAKGGYFPSPSDSRR